ncbi:MAG: carboxymuconolactone decarboxylase [Rhodospirillaceae bacterium]|nr:MAG: carboxymuconolactone decarboxylase [Rhodospirillaceae bacterium]
MHNVTERGLALFGEIMGSERAVAMRATMMGDGLGSAMADLAVNFAFGSVWAREGLERKQRSLVTIGILIAQRQLAELKNHIRIGLTNGLTVREIEEALLQSVPYVGFPTATSALSAIIEVLRDEGLDAQSRTPEERGML